MTLLIQPAVSLSWQAEEASQCRCAQQCRRRGVVYRLPRRPSPGNPCFLDTAPDTARSMGLKAFATTTLASHSGSTGPHKSHFISHPQTASTPGIGHHVSQGSFENRPRPWYIWRALRVHTILVSTILDRWNRLGRNCWNIRKSFIIWLDLDYVSSAGYLYQVRWWQFKWETHPLN